MTTTTIHSMSDELSAAFRAAFEAHPDRVRDPAMALQSARETVSALVPDDVCGDFDDEMLTFTDEVDEVVENLEGEGRTSFSDDDYAHVRGINDVFARRTRLRAMRILEAENAA